MVGNLSIITKENEKITETTNINFDDYGFFNGKYYTKDANNEEVDDYENGFLIKSIVRNLKTGKADLRDDAEIGIVFRDLFTKEKNNEITSNSRYSLVNYDNNFFRNKILSTFFGEQFHYKSIGGDINYEEPNYNFKGISYRNLKEK